MNFNIRAYEEKDAERLVELFRLNAPKYFDPEEEKDLIGYLEKDRELYYVIEVDKQIIGCGGINFDDDGKTAIISWDIFHPEFQGKGYGSELLQYRLKLIKEDSIVEKIMVRTSQLVFSFYQKNGFALIEVQKDFWAPGFDLYKMQHVSAK